MQNKSTIIKHAVRPQRISEKGFTLLEMVVIVVLSGILLSFLGASLLTFMRESQIKTTEYRLEQINEALGRYLSTNGRYPCAADRTLGPDTDVFAKEVTPDCDTGAFSGTVRVGAGLNRVRIGAVPTRTLNLTDEFIADAWGKKFKYAITERLATNLKYQADRGRVIIRDDADTNILTDAHYVVLSHGVTGDGGFPLGASTIATTPCPANSLDRRNCDDSDRIFRSTLVNADADLSTFYDDYVYYKNHGFPLAIPTGAVLPFDAAFCPNGWGDFLRGEGRFIIGSQPTPFVEDMYTRRLRSPSGSTSLNLFVGMTHDFTRPVVSTLIDPVTGLILPLAVWENIPPYTALRYCEKMPL